MSCRRESREDSCRGLCNECDRVTNCDHASLSLLSAVLIVVVVAAAAAAVAGGGGMVVVVAVEMLDLVLFMLLSLVLAQSVSLSVFATKNEWTKRKDTNMQHVLIENAVFYVLLSTATHETRIQDGKKDSWENSQMPMKRIGAVNAINQYRQ